jgi:glycine oxidase
MSGPIVIIGAGVVGLATALELAKRGAQVEVMERQVPGRESSWAGAGILSLLLPSDYGPALRALADYSVALYPAWIDALRGISRTDPEYRRCGMLVLDRRDPGVLGSGAPGAGPDVRLGPASEAETVWLPEVAQVRNPCLLDALIEACDRLGVRLHAGTPVTGLDADAGRVRAVLSGPRRWSAETVVVAAGAWSAALLGPLADALPIRPIRGQMLLYQAEPERLPCIVYQGGRYLVPRRDGLILAGSTLEDVGFDKTPTETARGDLHAFTAGLLPDVAERGPIRQWAGLRPGSPDNVPIIARHPRLANLYVNGGHFRYGVTLAPASARLLAGLLVGGEGGPDPRSYAWPDIIRAGPV